MSTPKQQEPRPPRPQRVLIIEDDPASRDLLRRMIESAGHHVLAAVESVGAAMGALLDDLPPDVVLLDYMLPDANGLEFLQTLRSLQAQPRVAIVSAVPNLDQNAELMALRPDALLPKPIHLDALIRFLDSGVAR